MQLVRLCKHEGDSTTLSFIRVTHFFDMVPNELPTLEPVCSCNNDNLTYPYGLQQISSNNMTMLENQRLLYEYSRHTVTLSLFIFPKPHIRNSIFMPAT